MGRYAVIGYPISHTLSPLIHNANFEAKGTADHYSAIAVHPDQLTHIREIIRSNGLDGFNVTIPHKEKIMAHLDHVDRDAMKIGAVNTVAVDGDVLTGYNTDVTGYLDAFNQTFGKQHRRILIIGAGGAAKAVHRAHANNGDSVTIAARRMERFQFFKTADFKAVLISDIPGLDPHDVIINTTPVGMKHEDLLKEMEIPESLITENTLGVDLIYQPEKTKFLEYFAENNYMNGMPMLIHQAMDAYTLWTGEQGDIAAVNRKYKAHIGGKS
ncbi:shikimate dehydrogenase [Salinicoccus hispanicus]|uniref:Shikimate dehydrogenase (NADP(+)) n=1 Tax=Salinicoccus hispanicus TaxID=157225 RepID=A0A6N8TZE2_9STAP|nr:shikimate dehydrogenase [Salinicoccus hispanicus]MXQ50066.1 shikimate dehydrogenase [Salinicoccus hispanicus]